MKQLKFGIFDIILAVVIVAGIGLNVYGYGFRADGKEVKQSPGSQTAQTTTPEVSAPELAESTQPEESPPLTPTQEPQNSFEDYRGYADGETPSIGDFFWFTENVKWDGLPANRTVITDFSAIAGYWKAYTESIIVFGADTDYKWFNAEISGDANQAAFTYHTKGFTGLETLTGQSGEEYDLSPWDGETSRGRFSDGKLIAGDITMKDFYALDGKQYAVGEINYPSGEKEHIVLVRP